MSIYVGPIKGNSFNKKLPKSSDLVADSQQELDEFVKRLSIKKDWKCDGYYALSPIVRLAAIRLGAIEVDDIFLVELRKNQK